MVSIEFEIIGLAVAYPFIAYGIQRKLTDTRKLYEIQDNINAQQKRQVQIQDALAKKQKEHAEIVKKEGVFAWEIEKVEGELKVMENDAKIEVEKIQKELITMLPNMLKHQLKSLIVVGILSLVVYTFLLPYAFAGPTAGMTFTPLKLNYKWLFIVTAFVIGAVLSLVITRYDKNKIKKEKAALQQNASQQ